MCRTLPSKDADRPSCPACDLAFVDAHSPACSSLQVMGMPGMVISTVESLVFLTPMAYDVMTFAILKQLASPKKKLKVRGSRENNKCCGVSTGRCAHLPHLLCLFGRTLQEDGVNLEEWYQWLTAFTGRFCKKYP